MEKKVEKASQTNSERTWATFVHVASFAGLVFPIGNIIAPLIIWLVKKDEFPLVDDQGKEVLNFQISMTIYVLVGTLLMIILIGFLIVIGLVIVDVILTIMAILAVNKGEKYRYPLSIKFIK